MTTEAQKRAFRKYYLANRERILVSRKQQRLTAAMSEEGRLKWAIKSRRKKVARRLAHPDAVKALRTRYEKKYPEKCRLWTRTSNIRKQFASVVDVEVKELLVETKLLQLNIKKLLKHGETNEKRN